MMDLPLSRHARTRMQQRSIPPIIVASIWEYGCNMRHDGASVYFLNREARNRLKRHIGARPYAQMENRLDAYVVVSDDGTIVTVGWRYKRFKRPGRRAKERRDSHRRTRRDRRRVLTGGGLEEYSKSRP